VTTHSNMQFMCRC